MGPVTVLDGGMGKELRRIGAPFRQPEWSSLALMEAPDRVLEAHRNFVDAGADVLITNNYAVVPFHLGEEVIAERGAELTTLAGRLAREAADGAGRDVRVAGSLPPLFGSYEPDRFDAARAAPYYRDIVAALAPFVDLWIGETFSCVEELHTIVDAVRAQDDRRPIWVGFCVPDEWDPTRGVALRSGETPAAIAAAVAEHQGEIDAVLFNCSLPEQTGPAIEALAAAFAERELDLRIGAYANAFPPQRPDGYAANEFVFERRAELTTDRYTEFAQSWVDLGATIVGGCCDLYPEHIAALAERFGRR